jgi:undecaprenyl phosphate-alpha-L-ara4FN deformylase
MGRHLWRLVRPTFLVKMLRTRAASLYGWDVLSKGTFWPGPVIGRAAADEIRGAAAAGHEIGLHAWDHHAWQARVERMSAATIRDVLQRGFDRLQEIIGRAPVASAVPAWKCTDLVLEEKLRFPYVYNSDCRGDAIFQPLVDGRPLPQPQIPVTLPTYDEIVGRDGITDRSYNDSILSRVHPDRLNVYTVHAEVEGIARLPLFERLLEQARARGMTFVPLGILLPGSSHLPQSAIRPTTLAGREGWISWQAPGRVEAC